MPATVGINNQYVNNQYGKDRLGMTTPQPDLCDPLQPWLNVPYPAPWLPIRRRDEGHPVAAGVVLSDGYLVGLDKSGALIPAGLKSGQTAASASGDTSNWCLVKYGADDVGMTINPKTGAVVAAAGEYVLLAAPVNASANQVIDGITVTANDIAFASACNLIPGGVTRPIGFCVRNVFQYLGGVDINSTTNGIDYKLNTMNPRGYRVHNYTHEPGTTIKTHFAIRVPWVGKSPAWLDTLASNLSITGYAQTDFARSFVHFTGDLGNAVGKLFPGCAVVASDQFSFGDSGHYAPYDSTKHGFDQIVGKVIGIEKMYPIRDYADRVRTQFERAQTFVGPFRDNNPNQMLMGGSATRGMDYALNLSTNGLFRACIDQGKTPSDEMGTYVDIHVRL